MRTRSIELIWRAVEARGHVANSAAAVADHDDVSACSSTSSIDVDHQLRDVRDVRSGCIAVGARERRQIDVAGRRCAGRSPCRAGARSARPCGLSRRSSVPALKLKPSMPTLRAARLSTMRGCRARSASSLLGRIASRIGTSTSRSARVIREGAHVLRQARAAEGEARLQVVGREVELRVLAEDVHHLVAVDAERLADVADLVGEADLQRVPGVVGVLHHLARSR